MLLKIKCKTIQQEMIVKEFVKPQNVCEDQADIPLNSSKKLGSRLKSIF